MTTFISHYDRLNNLISQIVGDEIRHAKWLNTLSFLENCGARKIAACEHPTLVKEEMLKHASEEFRHAHYLKKQIERVSSRGLPDYSLTNIMGGFRSLHYLKQLDLKTCAYLSKAKGLSTGTVRSVAYLLVTYAIELRAGELYQVYYQILKMNRSKVTINSIILEEKEHLEEMRQGINHLPHGEEYANTVCLIEGELCKKWLDCLT